MDVSVTLTLTPTLTQTPADSRTCYLLVDDADRLRDKGAGGDAGSKESVLPVLARLPELTRVNVCVVLIRCVRVCVGEVGGWVAGSGGL